MEEELLVLMPGIYELVTEAFALEATPEEIRDFLNEDPLLQGIIEEVRQIPGGLSLSWRLFLDDPSFKDLLHGVEVILTESHPEEGVVIPIWAQKDEGPSMLMAPFN